MRFARRQIRVGCRVSFELFGVRPILEMVCWSRQARSVSILPRSTIWCYQQATIWCYQQALDPFCGFLVAGFVDPQQSLARAPCIVRDFFSDGGDREDLGDLWRIGPRRFQRRLFHRASGCRHAGPSTIQPLAGS